MGTKNQFHINMGVDKADVAKRIERGKMVAAKAPTSALCIGDPAVAASCNDLVTCGTELQAAQTEVAKADMQAAAARTNLEEKIAKYDHAHKVCASQLEQRATSANDVLSVGFELRERVSYGIEAPSGITAKVDYAKSRITVHVERAPGIDTYLVEMSEGTAEPRVWNRLRGTGGVRTVKVAPGVYAFRATSMRANDESEPTEPVFVTMP